MHAHPMKSRYTELGKMLNILFVSRLPFCKWQWWAAICVLCHDYL